MNKFEIAMLLNDLENRISKIEKRFEIKNGDIEIEQLWLRNARLALEIDDEEEEKKE